MNHCSFIGRLTRDAEIRWTQGQDQKAVARFTLAVDRKFKKDGEAQADFISCVAFGKIADFLDKYGKKGIKFGVEGRWQTGSYTDKNGNKVYTNDCVVEAMEFVEKKASQGTVPDPQTDQDGFYNIPDNIDEELPFV